MSRIFRSDIEGNLDGGHVSDREICIILSDDAARGVHKIIGKLSRVQMLEMGLTDAETSAAQDLYQMLF